MNSICKGQSAIGKALLVAHCKLPTDQKGQSAKVNETLAENLTVGGYFRVKKFSSLTAGIKLLRRLILKSTALHEYLLIQGLKAGSEPAFDELVRRYGGSVYNTALGFLQNKEVAEDIAQEVFIQVFQGIGSFRGEAGLTTWIYRIVVNRSLDALRQQKRKSQSGVLRGLFGSRLKDEVTEQDFHHPGVATEQKEEAAILFKAIRQLPEQQQTAFLLQKTEGLSQSHIAEVMKLSEGAVESLLQRAKTNLRKNLSDYYQKHYR